MKAVKVNHGITHRVAICQSHDCDWEDAYGGAKGRSIEAISRAAKRHSEKTGHSVVVESGSSYQYQVVVNEYDTV